MMRVKVLVGLSLLFGFSSQVFAQNIFQAIQNGDIEQVKSILEEDENAVNSQDKDNDTPLHYAASQDNSEMVELLLHEGAALNTQNYQGYTPLHRAASGGLLKAAQTLVAAGADVHLKTKRGRTPLFLVAMNNGKVNLAKMLLDAGADVNTQENSGSTPLSYAPFRGFNDLIDLFLDYGAEVRVDSDLWFEVFHRACSIGHKRLTELMIEKGLDITKKNEDGRLPLHSASEGGALEVVKVLIEQGNAVNSHDYYRATPLHFAAAAGHCNIVNKLIELGANINYRNVMGETPFNLALEENRQEVIELLKERGADQRPPQFPVIRGKYLGQKKPGKVPEVFGPGLVSTYAPIHGCVTFTPDGKEMYWSIVDFQKRSSSIFQMKMLDGQWTKPEKTSFASQFSDDVPFCSPDGEKMYILTDRPINEGAETTKENIWMMERQGDVWGNAKPIGIPVNAMDLHWQFSVTSDDTIYFASSDGTGMGLNDIFVSRLVDEEYQKPENLGGSINSQFPDFAPYIFPDETCLIFTSMNRPEGSGLYISYKNDEGSWSKARHMGETFGSGILLTSMSPDEKHLFFTGRLAGKKGVFWTDAKIIEELRPK